VSGVTNSTISRQEPIVFFQSLAKYLHDSKQTIRNIIHEGIFDKEDNDGKEREFICIANFFALIQQTEFGKDLYERGSINTA